LQRNHGNPQIRKSPFKNSFLQFCKCHFAQSEGLMSPKEFYQSVQPLANYQNFSKVSNFLVQSSDSLKKTKRALMGIFVDIQSQTPPQLLLRVHSLNYETISFTL